MRATPGPTSRQRTPVAILEAASHVLAEHGEATMAEIADAAGVGRATVYRYYPSRETLLRALALEAFEDLAARIADADLDHAGVEEAIERIVRAVLAVGVRYAILVQERVPPDPEAVERLLAAPIQRVFQRGLDERLLRDDLELVIQLALFGEILRAGVTLATQNGFGLERATAVVTSSYLDGARRR